MNIFTGRELVLMLTGRDPRSVGSWSSPPSVVVRRVDSNLSLCASMSNVDLYKVAQEPTLEEHAFT